MPKKLERMAKSVNVDDHYALPDTDKVKGLLDKMRNGIELRNSEVKILCYFVSIIKEESLFDRFSSACEHCFAKQERLYYHIKGLLHSFYDDFWDPELFHLLQLAFDKNRVWKEPLASTKDGIFINSTSTTSCFLNLYRYFEGFKTFAELRQGKDHVLMKENHRIFNIISLRLLEERIISIKNLDDFSVVKDLINSLKDYNTLKPCLEKFLLTQKFREDFDKLPIYLEEMFNVIGDILGDPYGQNRTRWQGIKDEAKSVFTLWKTQKKIGLFFGEIAGDPIRLNFWKKYSHYFYRIEYYEKYAGAILMETNQHLFVEFAEMGALYMYNVKNLSINDVDRYFKSGLGKTAMIVRLKNKSIAKLNLRHLSRWQEPFQREFDYFGYKMRG